MNAIINRTISYFSHYSVLNMKREYVKYYNEYFIKLKVMKPYEVGNRKIYEKVLI